MRGPIPCKDCGKDTGSASPRCEACEKKRRDQWKAWLDAGKCPRCEGRRDLDPGTKSCFECGFGVDQPRGEVEDWVPLAVKNPRRFHKL
jgi:ribosomal protein L37E